MLRQASGSRGMAHRADQIAASPRRDSFASRPPAATNTPAMAAAGAPTDRSKNLPHPHHSPRPNPSPARFCQAPHVQRSVGKRPVRSRMLCPRIPDKKKASVSDARAKRAEPMDSASEEMRTMRQMLSSALILAVAACSAAFGKDDPETWTIRLGEANGAIRPLLGVNAGPLQPRRDGTWQDFTDDYRRAGVKQVRTHDYYGPLDMAAIFPDPRRDPAQPGALDFGMSDRAMRGILKGGFAPWLRIGDSWHVGQGVPPMRRRVPLDRARWVRAAVETVRHYRDMARQRLQYVEIWNEPDLRQFWDAPVKEFFPLFDEAVRAIKAAAPDVKVGGPAWTMAGWMAPRGREQLDAFLDYLQAHKTPWDFFSWHIYSNDPNEFAQAARYFRAQLNRRHWGKVESHVTEYNTDTRRRPLPEGLNEVDLRAGAPGAAILSAAWIALHREDVAGAYLYRGADPAADDPTFYGLFKAPGEPKKIALALALWARMAECRERLAAGVVGPATSPLWVLAGRTESGAVRLLVANPTTRAASWRLDTAGGNPPEELTLEQVSDGNASAPRHIAAGGAIRAPGWTTQLLTVEFGRKDARQNDQNRIKSLPSRQ